MMTLRCNYVFSIRSHHFLWYRIFKLLSKRQSPPNFAYYENTWQISKDIDEDKITPEMVVYTQIARSGSCINPKLFHKICYRFTIPIWIPLKT